MSLWQKLHLVLWELGHCYFDLTMSGSDVWGLFHTIRFFSVRLPDRGCIFKTIRFSPVTPTIRRPHGKKSNCLKETWVCKNFRNWFFFLRCSYQLDTKRRENVISAFTMQLSISHKRRENVISPWGRNCQKPKLETDRKDNVDPFVGEFAL